MSQKRNLKASYDDIIAYRINIFADRFQIPILDAPNVVFDVRHRCPLLVKSSSNEVDNLLHKLAALKILCYYCALFCYQ